VPYTLLLADDSVTIQRVIELTFADEDVTVIAVSDGDQAIARLEASPPDIVLADIGMPGKNGYEVAQYIRRSPRLAHIPVVLLTGAFEPVDQARANEAGCDGVLAKPFEPQLVIGRVKELLARSRRDPSSPALATAEPEPEPVVAENDDFALPAIPLVEPRSADTSIAAEPGGAGARSELNDYFDRLDAAFSTLSSNVPAESPVPATPAAEAPPVALDMAIDWFGTTPGDLVNTEPWDLPAPSSPDDLSLADVARAVSTSSAPATPTSIPEAEPVTEVARIPEPDERLAPIEESTPVEPEAPPPETAPPVERPAPVEPVAAASAALELPLPNAPPLPALADAFAALLAAEQGEPQSPDAGAWPATMPAAAAVNDELIEDVIRRVLDRLSETVVREAVADVASKVAERLIREEIERIKASIK
jgi:CheY-like chemotaxis protein